MPVRKPHPIPVMKKKRLDLTGNTEWGADRKVMLCLYRYLVRSKLDYGCIVYGDALCMGPLVSLTYKCWIPYTTMDLDFVLEHFELLL